LFHRGGQASSPISEECAPKERERNQSPPVSEGVCETFSRSSPGSKTNEATSEFLSRSEINAFRYVLTGAQLEILIALQLDKPICSWIVNDMPFYLIKKKKKKRIT
jgi:hypothetical protein